MIPRERRMANELKRALEGLEGVDWAEVDAIVGRAVVLFDPEALELDDLITVVEDVEDAHDARRRTVSARSPRCIPTDMEPVQRNGFALGADAVGIGIATAGPDTAAGPDPRRDPRRLRAGRGPAPRPTLPGSTGSAARRPMCSWRRRRRWPRHWARGRWASWWTWLTARRWSPSSWHGERRGSAASPISSQGPHSVRHDAIHLAARGRRRCRRARSSGTPTRRARLPRCGGARAGGDPRPSTSGRTDPDRRPQGRDARPRGVRCPPRHGAVAGAASW